LKPDQKDIDDVIARALAEDVGPGDITSKAVIPESAVLRATMRAREPLIVAGLDVALAVFHVCAPDCQTEVLTPDGARIEEDTVLARISGNARGLLTAERTALNILQHLSGVATLAQIYAERVKGTQAVILDTRKTLPGLRALEKYAARMGGARNHRMGLYDAVLIKDNHIAVCGGLAEAVAAARAAGHTDIEAECDTLDEVEIALEAGVPRLLLDNMSLDDLRRAVRLAEGRAVTEASGGVTLANVRSIAETGVDYISVGRITQSAPAVDIGLDYLPNPPA
jgi:nicotinate-nucleotide pyrophosphorylase (carboxylating)